MWVSSEGLDVAEHELLAFEGLLHRCLPFELSLPDELFYVLAGLLDLQEFLNFSDWYLQIVGVVILDLAGVAVILDVVGDVFDC